MIELFKLKAETAAIIQGLEKRNFKDAQNLIGEIIETDNQRKQVQTQLDQCLAQSNQYAKEIGALMKQGQKADAEEKKVLTAELKTRSKELEKRLEDLEQTLHDQLVRIPNVPYHLVKAGKSAEDNEVVFQVTQIPTLFEGALPHWDLIKKLDIIDFELGNKIAGAGFPVYKGKGAKLQRALINFFLDQAEAEGYHEVQVPLLVNADSGFATGQLPDKDGQMYYATEDKLYLIPTAEVPVTNLYRDVIVEEKSFPIKHAAYTACFRREAGSWGAHVRGLNRLHQFDKIEIVQIQHPDKSYETLEAMSKYVQSLLEKLELPYRVLRLCGGDMGFTSAMTYDMEVWSAAQQRWLEVSSVSNFETYQANRLKLRFKNKEGKMQLAHTLNGSALALPRIVAAILENNQTPDGKIKIPKVLLPYTRFEEI